LWRERKGHLAFKLKRQSALRSKKSNTIFANKNGIFRVLELAPLKLFQAYLSVELMGLIFETDLTSKTNC